MVRSEPSWQHRPSRFAQSRTHTAGTLPRPYAAPRAAIGSHYGVYRDLTANSPAGCAADATACYAAPLPLLSLLDLVIQRLDLDRLLAEVEAPAELAIGDDRTDLLRCGCFRGGWRRGRGGGSPCGMFRRMWPTGKQIANCSATFCTFRPRFYSLHHARFACQAVPTRSSEALPRRSSQFHAKTAQHPIRRNASWPQSSHRAPSGTESVTRNEFLDSILAAA